ncbi:MAG: response regulator [Bacteroidetes bacterium]|nr:MAG: response regulator [Bacteroidota bacterium]
MSNIKKVNAVMLIDDNEIDNLINQKMIESVNMTDNIFVHSGAKSALEYLKNIEKIKVGGESFLPEFIFLDIDMPLMDGFQFVDEFEKLSDFTKNYCKVILLTSSLDPKDITKSKKNSYIVRYLNKPLTQDSLKKLVTV